MNFSHYDAVLASIQASHNKKVRGIKESYFFFRIFQWLCIPALPCIVYMTVNFLNSVGVILPLVILAGIAGFIAAIPGCICLFGWASSNKNHEVFEEKLAEAEKQYKQELGLRFASAYHSGENAIINLFVMNPSICSEDTLNFIRNNKVKVEPVRSATITLD